MVISLDSKPKRVRAWFKGHVYRMFDFRILFEQEKASRDPQEKKRLNQKLEHPREKVEQHMAYGKILGIDEDQMRRFNLAIIEEVKKGRKPQAIIQALIKENGHN